MTRHPFGAVAARRAVLRWSWRLFRREWRQHAIVLALLSVAVAAAVGLAAAAFNLAPVSGNAEFGTGSAYFRFERLERPALDETLAAATAWFGATDPIGHTPVPVPGDVATVDYRTQDPAGPFGGPLLDLLDGRYPAGEDEVAVAPGVVDLLGVGLGDTLDLDGHPRSIVGLVENPSRLADVFALLPPGGDPPAVVDVLVRADQERVDSFRPPGATTRLVSIRADVPEGTLAAVAALLVASVALFLVSLVATASFIVVAQRRLRQLGVLAAVGASERHLRLVLVAAGAIAGAVAAVVGSAVGVAGWLLVAPRVEAAAGYRVDAANVPWWLVGSATALSVLAATGASWWPARTLARVPVVQALSGRPPEPTPVRRSAALAAASAVVGLACLLATGDITDPSSDTSGADLGLLVVGTIAVLAGILLFAPIAVRAVARVAGRLPVAARLALRDLGRAQARSGAALAAVSLALGIPVAIVAAAGAAGHGADAGNLSDRQIVVRNALDAPIAPTAAVVDQVRGVVADVAATLDHPVVEELRIAVDPAFAQPDDVDGRWAVSVGVADGDGYADRSLVYVATPSLLAPYGLDEADLGTDVASTETDELVLLGLGATQGSGRQPPGIEVRPLAAGYTSVPGTFVTEEGLAARGWEAASAGRWLLESSSPLTDEQLDRARELAADADLTIETRDRQQGLGTLRTIATAAGMALALGILALTVGLIRGETAADVRTLTAAGATSSTRRLLAATTAGTLALLGVLLGATGAYAAVTAALGGHVGRLRPVPLGDLALIALGTPAVAALAGWLLAGREPRQLARQATE